MNLQEARDRQSRLAGVTHYEGCYLNGGWEHEGCREAQAITCAEGGEVPGITCAAAQELRDEPRAKRVGQAAHHEWLERTSILGRKSLHLEVQDMTDRYFALYEVTPATGKEPQ